MAHSQDVFDCLTQHAMKETAGIAALGEFLRHHDLTTMRPVLAEIQLDHGQEFRHRLQTCHPTVDAAFEAKRSRVGKAVVGDHIRDVIGMKAERTVDLFGDVGSAVTRHADDVHEVEFELDVFDHRDITGQQRDQNHKQGKH